MARIDEIKLRWQGPDAWKFCNRTPSDGADVAWLLSRVERLTADLDWAIDNLDADAAESDEYFEIRASLESKE